MVRQRQHPADGCFGHGTIDRSDRDQQCDVGSRAGGNIDRVVAHAKPCERQQIICLGETLR